MKRSLATATLVAVPTFVILYAVAAVLYPGGTRAEPERVGFSFRDNYWCDLLDTTTYGGRPNPAAPIALGATVVLALGFAALSWTLPALFPATKTRARIVASALVRGAGVASAFVTPLIATRHHDVVVNVAAACGAITLVVSMTAIRAREGRPILFLGIAAFASAALNFVLWRTGFMLPVIPLVQKGAFAAFLLWVFVIARRVRQ